MRRLILLVLVVAALAVPVGAGAATTVQKTTFDATFALCNGDLIHVSGPLLVTFSETTTPTGGGLFAVHFQPQGVIGVDLVTGTVFRATGLTRDLTVSSPAGGMVETFVDRFHIQATGGAQSYIVSELAHITITPSGTVAVSFDNFASTC
jgi:hypothetical protein